MIITDSIYYEIFEKYGHINCVTYNKYMIKPVFLSIDLEIIKKNFYE